MIRIILLLLSALIGANAFLQNGAAATPRTSLSMTDSTASDVKKATLTDETTWRLRLLLNDVTTTKGRKLDGQLFVVEGNFIEEEG